MSVDVEVLKGWVGREERSVDLIDFKTLSHIRAFFGFDPKVSEGEPLPELWHWFFFHPLVARNGFGADGHPKVGDFLPAFDLPRRMWGGSKLKFLQPLHAGAKVEKLSKIISVDLKQGKSGQLGLVRVEHSITQSGRLCVTEFQDIVYREAANGPQSIASALDCPEGAVESLEILPDTLTLFRYSALTRNAHRIHYDREYARAVEGYPGLVVHGPFTAMQLALFANNIRGGAPMKAFSFRGTSPLFDEQPFQIHAKPDRNSEVLWAERPSGGMAMTALAEY